MTLYAFKLLVQDAQADLTWQDGVLLGFRQTSDQHMMLYRLEDFYVEFVYDSHQNEITEIRSFINDTLLEPYLAQIDLTGLLY